MPLSTLTDAEFCQSLMARVKGGEGNIQNWTRNTLREQMITRLFLEDNKVRIPDVLDAEAQAELTARLAVMDKAINAMFATGIMPKTREEMEAELTANPGFPM